MLWWVAIVEFRELVMCALIALNVPRMPRGGVGTVAAAVGADGGVASVRALVGAATTEGGVGVVGAEGAAAGGVGCADGGSTVAGGCGVGPVGVDSSGSLKWNDTSIGSSVKILSLDVFERADAGGVA